MNLPSSMADFVPCDRLLQKAQLLSVLVRALRDCAIIIWRRRGWEIRGGIGENYNKRGRGGWMYNLIHRGGHYFFIPFCKLEK